LDELQASLNNAETSLYLAFQPVVAVAGGDEAQFQVLLRMHAPDGGIRRAGEFLHAAEHGGLLPRLGRWVMAKSIGLRRQRRAESRPIRLFVSQAPRTLGQDDFAEWLQQELTRTGVEGPSLAIDFRLEDALVHALLLRQLCEQLVPAGVQFCL